MATISANNKDLVINYYRSGLSAQSIADSLGVSIDAVYYFLRKYRVPRRKPSESNLILFQRKKLSFKIKDKLTLSDKLLKMAGVVLYWGEGSKWSGEKIVDFANSDPGMIKVFLSFLRKICGIDEKKLRVYLYCYSNQDIKKLINFWSNSTKISRQQFTKPYIRKDWQESKIGKMRYGLIHIRYCDKKLLQLIKNWIDELVKNY